MNAKTYKNIKTGFVGTREEHFEALAQDMFGWAYKCLRPYAKGQVHKEFQHRLTEGTIKEARP